MPTPDPLPPEVIKYYESGREQNRLQRGRNQLEMARTQEIIQRFLQGPPATILDVGGGPGVYSCWLAKLGYQAHLIDAVPFLVEQASQASQSQPERPIASCSVGDARQLSWPDESVDAVLLLGPMYHLIHRGDRLIALREALRVLRPGGLLFAAAISRFASVLDGLFQINIIDDELFNHMAQRDLAEGVHRNPTGEPGYFTTAFQHNPEDFKSEVVESGFQLEAFLAVEGPAGLLQNFNEHWDNPERREKLLGLLRLMETEPSIIGVSAHILAVGRKIG